MLSRMCLVTLGRDFEMLLTITRLPRPGHPSAGQSRLLRTKEKTTFFPIQRSLTRTTIHLRNKQPCG